MMPTYLQIASPEVLFVADTHFRGRDVPAESDRRARFIRFLDAVPGGSTLVLLGDIFDFYFEYASVVSKRYLDLYIALVACKTRGVDLHFLGGNHDFWVGDFLTRELGITLHGDVLLIECQGRKICCEHGDLCLPGDKGYKRLRAVIRNPFVIAAAKIIHPDLMDGIAGVVSAESKKRNRPSQEETADAVAATALDRFYHRGNDAFVMGHVHFPLLRNLDGKQFMIVGDWITHFTYGRLREGELSLLEFKS